MNHVICRTRVLTSWIPILLQVYVMDAANLEDGLWSVRERVSGVQYFLEHHHGFFYILHDFSLENVGPVSEGYHLARCRAEKPLLSSWQVRLSPSILLCVFCCFGLDLTYFWTLIC